MITVRKQVNTHPCTLRHWQCTTIFFLLAIPHYLASFFVLGDPDCFPVYNQEVAPETDVNLILLDARKIKCSRYRSAIV